MTIHNSQEADARIIIDGLLRQSGWDPADKSQVVTERVTSDGTQADYLLLSANGRPLAVIEAKKESIDLYTAKLQTLPYAQSLQAPFIFLSNGDHTYFWDYRQDDARLVDSFFSRRDLERLIYLRQQRKALPQSRWKEEDCVECAPNRAEFHARPASKNSPICLIDGDTDGHHQF